MKNLTVLKIHHNTLVEICGKNPNFGKNSYYDFLKNFRNFSVKTPSCDNSDNRQPKKGTETTTMVFNLTHRSSTTTTTITNCPLSISHQHHRQPLGQDWWSAHDGLTGIHVWAYVENQLAL